MLGSTDKYYHKYDCPHFTQKNFVAYSTKLAEANKLADPYIIYIGQILTVPAK